MKKKCLKGSQSQKDTVNIGYMTQALKVSEIRERFLKFFESKGHQIVESSSIVPSNDPTLLFTAAGMVQFKDLFLGKEKRDYKRATTVQKCVRAGGKHNDLENVGFTARHHTFFEMLGNFSFGDYFKKEAISFAWEFVTKELKLPIDKLYVTVFETDDEAAEIWHHQEGVAKDRIYRFGEKDNFWAMGDTGPCGPCTELFIDRGEVFGCGKPTCKMGCDCDRFMEFWNLVFMQYNRDASGKLTPLPKPSVDTGAGLERIASILQEVETNYDTDLFQNIIQSTSKLCGISYDRKNDLSVSFRVIADHARAATFLIGDGVMPSNEGRGYVLRRILRRAIRHGKKLGFTKPFINEVSGFVIDEMSSAYPDLKDKRSFISKAIFAEEEQFLRTLEKGLVLLDDEISKLTHSKLPGAVAFKLYDTYGFPLDLTRVICEEKNISVDEIGFESAMNQQRAESRKNWKGTGEQALDAIYLSLVNELKEKNSLPQFKGYDVFDAEGVCVALLQLTDKGLVKINEATALPFSDQKGSEETLVEALFNVSPFYGESGGQVGDKGRVFSVDFEGEVFDVQRPTPELISVHLKVKKGTISVGQKYVQWVDQKNRKAITKNHTATHLLHWALRKHFGNHVKQAGSLVTESLLRFDFTHFEPMSSEDLKIIENMINEKIWSDSGVSKKVMKKEEALASGAIAFFGEKYGDEVRVVKVGDYSTELCGGCHVDRASDIHLFKIQSEAGIAAGVRRIIATTSESAFHYLDQSHVALQRTRDLLKAQSLEETPSRVEKTLQTEKELRKQIETFKVKEQNLFLTQLMNQKINLGKVNFIGTELSSSEFSPSSMRELADLLKVKDPLIVGVFMMKDGEKRQLAVAAGSEAQKIIPANALLKDLLPLIDGRGGGKPDFAQAGGMKAANFDVIESSAKEILSKK